MKITYLGPKRLELGWKLGGVSTVACESGEEMLLKLEQETQSKKAGIVLLDEDLADGVLTEIEKFNEAMVPAIVLVSGPMGSKRLSAKRLDHLMIKAIGSDIFSK